MARGRVLVVDDTRFFRAALSGMLREAGWDVLEAEDGNVALRIAGTEALDLVILDLQMPGLDGFQVLDRLRGAAASREVPVLVLSGSGLPVEDVERLRTLGAFDFIDKSNGIPEVGARIESLLEERDSGTDH